MGKDYKPSNEEKLAMWDFLIGMVFGHDVRSDIKSLPSTDKKKKKKKGK